MQWILRFRNLKFQRPQDTEMSIFWNLSKKRGAWRRLRHWLQFQESRFLEISSFWNLHCHQTQGRAEKFGTGRGVLRLRHPSKMSQHWSLASDTEYAWHRVRRMHINFQFQKSNLSQIPSFRNRRCQNSKASEISKLRKCKFQELKFQRTQVSEF